MPVVTVYCNRCGLGSSDDAQFCQRCGAAFAVRVLPPAATSSAIVVHYAGFWIRAVAAIIDFCIMFAATLPLKTLFSSVITIIGLDASMPTHQIFTMRRAIRIAIGIAMVFSYRTLMESSTYQATVGKLLLRLKVTDLSGSRIGFGRAAGRYLAKYLSFFSLGIGYLMVGFDEQKQGLHDRLAGTLVLYREQLPHHK